MLHTKVREGSIGPAHDPYGTTEVIARDGTKTATFYTDGLGRHRLELIDGERLIRGEEWFDLYNSEALKRGIPEAIRLHNVAFKAKLLFKRFIGADVDSIIEEWWNRPAHEEAPRIWM